MSAHRVLRRLEWNYMREVDHDVFVRSCPLCEGLDPSDSAPLKKLAEPYVSDDEIKQMRLEGKRLEGDGWVIVPGRSYMTEYKPLVGHAADCELAKVLAALQTEKTYGQVAYEAYGASLERRGVPALPAWTNLTKEEQADWHFVAAVVGGEEIEDEGGLPG